MARKASNVTTDHQEIRRWAEERGGRPASVARTETDGEPGILRIDFPPYGNEGKLEDVSWDDWFEKFDERNLALIYSENSALDGTSYFNKLVSRDSADSSQSKTGQGSRKRRTTLGRNATRGTRSSTARSSSQKQTRSSNSKTRSARSSGTRKRSAGSRAQTSKSQRSSSSRSRSAVRKPAQRVTSARRNRTTTRGKAA